MSSDLLVPKWPADKERGWVIPVFADQAIRLVFQFEPQEQQVFDIPALTLTPIRPKILAGDKPIDRIVIAISGSPNSRVEIQDWQYDGPTVSSLSYFLLGTDQSFGEERWIAGGFSVKPLFLNLEALRAKYDGVAKYNSGFLYF